MSAPSGPRSTSGRWTARLPRWWGAAALFCAGVLVGVVTAGLLSADPVVPVPVAADGSGQGVPSVDRSAGPGGAEAAIAVNAACLRAVNEAEDAYRAIDDLAAAAGELNALRVDEVVRRLQPVQVRLGRDVDECRVVTGATSEPPAPRTADAGPDPVPAEPSATPPG